MFINICFNHAWFTINTIRGVHINSAPLLTLLDRKIIEYLVSEVFLHLMEHYMYSFFEREKNLDTEVLMLKYHNITNNCYFLTLNKYCMFLSFSYEVDFIFCVFYIMRPIFAALPEGCLYFYSGYCMCIISSKSRCKTSPVKVPDDAVN